MLKGLLLDLRISKLEIHVTYYVRNLVCNCSVTGSCLMRFFPAHFWYQTSVQWQWFLSVEHLPWYCLSPLICIECKVLTVTSSSLTIFWSLKLNYEIGILKTSTLKGCKRRVSTLSLLLTCSAMENVINSHLLGLTCHHSPISGFFKMNPNFDKFVLVKGWAITISRALQHPGSNRQFAGPL